MIDDLYAQITPDNHDQILEHVTHLEHWNSDDLSRFQIGRYVNIFILEDSRIYWTIYEVCSHKKVHASFEELLTQLFITQLEN